MSIATYRGERSISEIANKKYKRLTPRQREKAEAAILKANPQLKNIRNLRKGSVLRVPDLPELRAKTNRDLDNPEAQVARDLADTLKSFSEKFAERLKVEQENTKAQSKLLKSAKFKREISGKPSLQSLSGAAAKALDARSKSFKERQTNVKAAISQASKDLAARFD